MPRVHVQGARWGVSRESVASAIQNYTGMGTIEARRAADEAVSGRAISVFVEDFVDVYELADLLVGLGLEAEADESDDVAEL
jgi:hypothetical protein